MTRRQQQITIPPPEVSITIVLHNSEQELAECLAALQRELDQGFAELIAVDNASPDDSVVVVERDAPDARVVRSPENRGFAAGVNLAWPHVRGRYWLLLNPDAAFADGDLRALVAWMDDRPELAIGSPAISNIDGTTVWPSAQALPSVALVWLELLRLHRVLPRRVQAQLLQGGFWTYGDQLNAGWVTGTAMIVRRSAVEHVGLPDERFFMYAEDMDWCWSMRSAGWGVGYCSGVVVRHVGCASSDRTFGRPQTLLQSALAQTEAVRKRRGPVRARIYAASMAVFRALDSLHPRRPVDQREASRAMVSAWWSAAVRPALARADRSLTRAPAVRTQPLTEAAERIEPDH